MKAMLSALFLGLALCAQAPSASAQGAVVSIAGLLQAVAPGLTSIPFPGFGTVGGLSLSTLNSVPGLSLIVIPEIGPVGSLPVIGSITVLDGLTLLESVAPFQSAILPALPGFPH